MELNALQCVCELELNACYGVIVSQSYCYLALSYYWGDSILFYFRVALCQSHYSGRVITGVLRKEVVTKRDYRRLKKHDLGYRPSSVLVCTTVANMILEGIHEVDQDLSLSTPMVTVGDQHGGRI